ncbi:MAG: phosphopantetheine-binding protein, partial [Anaerolineales bacterium]|nr:phosphopantetheine-binding protein [Anaerolineales bacterium]
FAVVRDTYDIPRRDDLMLSDYNTLSKVIQYVMDSLGEIPAPQAEPVLGASAEKAPNAEKTHSEVEIEAHVVGLVSEKTGYPREMLELDLDLEADLGVDTVKQAELFAVVRDTYDIPRRDDLMLSDYNTLSKVIRYVMDSLDEKEQDAPEIPAEEVEKAEQPEVSERFTEISQAGYDSIKRRVPMPVLRPRLDVCKDTGITLGPDKRFILVMDDGKVGKSLLRRLRARKVKALTLHDPSLEEVIESVESWHKEGSVDGVFFLPALDVEAPIHEMDEAQWNAEIRKRVYVLYTLMRALPGDVPLISATRLGGTFGYSEAGSSAPFGGAVCGFTKAYGWEARNALVKVVDFAPEMRDREIAEKLIAETLRDPGAVEIGWDGDLRFSIAMMEQPLSEQKGVKLGADDVFLVTGGAGAITGTIVQDLANASRGTFYLADLAPLPDGDDPDLEKFRTDQEALKKELIQRMSSEGEKVTPVMIEKRLFSIERAASIHSLLTGIEKAGGKVVYIACDATDGGAVSGLVEQIIAAEGRLDYV